MCLLLLLLAAFAGANALSLALMAAVAAGMACAPRGQRAVWRWAVVPATGLALAWQYSVLVGLPPGVPGARGGGGCCPFGLDDDVASWLGLANVSRAEVWLLFFAYGSSVLQVRPPGGGGWGIPGKDGGEAPAAPLAECNSMLACIYS